VIAILLDVTEHDIPILLEFLKENKTFKAIVAHPDIYTKEFYKLSKHGHRLTMPPISDAQAQRVVRVHALDMGYPESRLHLLPRQGVVRPVYLAFNERILGSRLEDHVQDQSMDAKNAVENHDDTKADVSEMLEYIHVVSPFLMSQESSYELLTTRCHDEEKKTWASLIIAPTPTEKAKKHQRDNLWFQELIQRKQRNSAMNEVHGGLDAGYLYGNRFKKGGLGLLYEEPTTTPSTFSELVHLLKIAYQTSTDKRHIARVKQRLQGYGLGHDMTPKDCTDARSIGDWFGPQDTQEWRNVWSAMAKVQSTPKSWSEFLKRFTSES
jgi:hypothetical protein